MSSYCGGEIDVTWHMVDMGKIGKNESNHLKFSSWRTGRLEVF